MLGFRRCPRFRLSLSLHLPCYTCNTWKNGPLLTVEYWRRSPCKAHDLHMMTIRIQTLFPATDMSSVLPRPPVGLQPLPVASGFNP